MSSEYQCPACGTKNEYPDLCNRCWDLKTSLYYIQLSPNGLEKSLKYFNLEKIDKQIEKENNLLKLKLKIQKKLKERREQKRKKFIRVAPRYDAIFYGGVNWLDSL
jgi:hypothetical protein